MVATLVRRERRPLWVALAFAFAAAALASFWMSGRAREQAITDTSARAQIAAQTDLAKVLVPKELATPATGERARELREDIDRTVTSLGTFDQVHLYSAQGRLLYADGETVLETRPLDALGIVAEAAKGSPQTRIVAGVLETYVPIRLTPGGPVAVAELTRPWGPLSASATGGWNLAIAIAGILALVSLAMTAVTAAARPTDRRLRGSLYQPAVPRRPAIEPLTPAATAADGSVFASGERAALEERLVTAEARAEAAEENFRTVQAQLKAALAQIHELEGRLAMQENEYAAAGTDVSTLRDQLQETAERLHKAEVDNDALRERMALRSQELDQVRDQLQTMRGTTAEVSKLRERLDTAENSAAALVRELERVENELDYTKSKFHMTKLSEALREFDNDEQIEIQDEDEDDLFEHPVIIHNGSRLSNGKVR